MLRIFFMKKKIKLKTVLRRPKLDTKLHFGLYYPLNVGFPIFETNWLKHDPKPLAMLEYTNFLLLWIKLDRELNVLLQKLYYSYTIKV